MKEHLSRKINELKTQKQKIEEKAEKDKVDITKDIEEINIKIQKHSAQLDNVPGYLEPELDKYIKKIKEYMKDEKTAKKISGYFVNHNPNRKNTGDVELSDAIMYYGKYYAESERLESYHQPNSSVVKEMKFYKSIIDKKLPSAMRNYDRVRDLILWEQKYLQKQERETKKDNDSQLKTDDLIRNSQFVNQDVAIEEIKNDIETLTASIKNQYCELWLREAKKLPPTNILIKHIRESLLKKVSLEDLNYMPKRFLEKYKIDIDKIKNKEERDANNIIKEYKDDKIYDLYNEGGPSSIIEYMDLDDLVRYPKVVLEDVGVNLDGLGFSNGDYSNNEKLR